MIRGTLTGGMAIRQYGRQRELQYSILSGAHRTHPLWYSPQKGSIKACFYIKSILKIESWIERLFIMWYTVWLVTMGERYGKWSKDSRSCKLRTKPNQLRSNLQSSFWSDTLFDMEMKKHRAKLSSRVNIFSGGVVLYGNFILQCIVLSLNYRGSAIPCVRSEFSY